MTQLSPSCTWNYSTFHITLMISSVNTRANIFPTFDSLVIQAHILWTECLLTVWSSILCKYCVSLLTLWWVGTHWLYYDLWKFVDCICWLISQALELKERGNACLKEGKFHEALLHSSHAIKREPRNHLLYSNRSHVLLKLDQYYLALEDARKAIQLDPKWAKVGSSR